MAITAKARDGQWYYFGDVVTIGAADTAEYGVKKINPKRVILVRLSDGTEWGIVHEGVRAVIKRELTEDEKYLMGFGAKRQAERLAAPTLYAGTVVEVTELPAGWTKGPSRGQRYVVIGYGRELGMYNITELNGTAKGRYWRSFPSANLRVVTV